jgi:hypothetical protein
VGERGDQDPAGNAILAVRSRRRRAAMSLLVETVADQTDVDRSSREEDET